MGIISKDFDIRYFTHMIIFPDEDCFIEQKPFIHDLQFELANLRHDAMFIALDIPFSEIADELLKKGEFVWETRYPPGGTKARLTHRLIIESKERKCGWQGLPSKNKEGIL